MKARGERIVELRERLILALCVAFHGGIRLIALGVASFLEAHGRIPLAGPGSFFPGERHVSRQPGQRMRQGKRRHAQWSAQQYAGAGVWFQRRVHSPLCLIPRSETAGDTLPCALFDCRDHQVRAMTHWASRSRNGAPEPRTRGALSLVTRPGLELEGPSVARVGV